MEPLFRLSEPQRGIYFGEQWQGNAQLYQVIGISRIDGPLDVAAVAKTMQRIHELQPALRLAFVDTDEGPRQIVRDQVTPDHDFIDLGTLDETDFVAYCKTMVDEARAWQFDLSSDVMMRSRVLKYGPDRFALFIQVHHVICDAWGISVIYNQISRLVPLIAADPDYTEAPQEGFLDYLDFEQSYLEGNRLDKDADYWREKISALQPFPLEHAFPRVKKSHTAKRVEQLLDQSPAIYAYCEARNQSVYTFFAALLGLYLHKMCGLPSLALGVSVLNRPRKSHKAAVGMFSNFIPLLCEPDKASTFAALMDQIEADSKRDFRRQRYPIHRLLKSLDMTEARLTPVQFNYQNSLYDDGFAGLPHDPVWYFSEAEEHVLTFNINDFQAGGIRLSLDYSTDVFDDIEPVFARLHHLLDQVLTGGDTPLTDLDPIPKPERALLAGFEPGPAATPHSTHVLQRFLTQAARRPSRPALIAGEEIWSYGRLEEQTRRYAAALQQAEVQRGDAVLMQLSPGPEAVAAMWAVWWIGAVYVPVQVDAPKQRYQQILEKTKARCVIAEKHDNADALITPAVAATVAPVTGTPTLNPLDLAYVIFTSGSTGTPKGVLNDHAALAHYATIFNDMVGVNDQTRVGQQASPTFDTSLEEMVPVLTAGGSLIFLAREDLHDGQRLWATLAQDEITLLSTTPAVVALLNEQVPPATSLRTLISGGDALQPGDYDRLPDTLQIYNSYGPTETTICATYADLSKDGHSLGRPLPGYHVRLVDQNDQRVPIGVTGELHIGGLGVSKGYLHQPEATAERFYHDEAGQAWYRSGDLAKWDHNGRLHFVGRADRQISVRGFRIEPGDIEAALVCHDAIRSAAITTVGDGADRQLIAHVACSALPDNLREFLADHLPAHMIPWRFQRYEDLPRNTAGKIDTKQLTEINADETASQTTPPETVMEQRLAAIWEQVLGQPITQREAHFFRAGGHSLKATHVVRLVHEQLGVKMPLAIIFEQPLLRQQAAWLAQQKPTETAIIPPRPEGDDVPLSHAQEQLYLLQQRRPQDTGYHLPLFLELTGELDRTRLAAALQKVVDRHEALRAHFIVRNGNPRMTFHATMPLRLGGFTIKPNRLDEALARELFTPFHLEHGPLFRAALWHTGDDRAVLSLVFHHIISDATSVDLILEELVAHYKGDGDLLPEPFPLSRYAAWQRSETPSFAETSLPFWQQRFETSPPPLELPIQQPRQEGLRPAGLISRQIPQETLAVFDAWLSQHHATRFMGLHAALAWLLHLYSNERDITIGAPLAARAQHQLNHSVGFYANTLALRCQVDPNESAESLLARLRSEDGAAFDHADLPFARLIETLQPQTEPGRMPIFDVMLVLLNTRDHYQGLPGVEAKRLVPPVRHAKFDWLFSFREDGEDLYLDFEYDADLYSEARAEGVAQTLITLPRLMAQDGQRPLTQHRLVPYQTESAPKRHYAKTSAYFEAMAANYPNHIAVENEHQRADYAAVHRRVIALAGQLEHAGVQPGEVVAVAHRDPFERVVALLALLRMGAVFLPLDPAQPAERNQFALDDAGARLIIAEQLPDWAQSATLLKPGNLAPASPRKPYPAAPQDPAYLLYTSGSTGTPKAVLQTHACLNHLIDWQLTNLPGRRRVLQFAAFTFDVFLQETLYALCGGSTLILPDSETRRDLAALRRLIEDQQVTVAFLPYTALRRLCEDAPTLWGRRLRHLITAGEALIKTDALTTFLKQRPNLKLHNHYGPTETHVVTAYTLPEDEQREQPPIGTVIGAVKARVCNPQGQVLPPGARGELWLAGPCVAAGYHQRPEETAAKFVQADGRRWYRTGDLVHHDEHGCFHFHGRLDQQVKVRGYRVECGEIEHLLLAAENVDDVAVVVDRREQTLWAWLVGESLPDATHLRALLQRSLPEWMIPTRFVSVETLPFTASGKIDRLKLAQRRSHVQPLNLEPETGAATNPPRTETERLLAAHWIKLLPLSGKNVDREADFFTLGGNSITGARLGMILEQEQGMRLPLRWVFEHPRLCDLAKHLDVHREAGSFEPIPQRSDREFAPLSHAQRVMWTACQNPARAAAYHIPATFHLAGVLQRDLLTQALADLSQRHEALQTRFVWRGGTVWQQFSGSETATLPLIETASPADAREAAQQFIEKPFDLENESPLRAAVFSENDHQPGRPGTYLAVFVIHHLVADGWSLDVLMRDWLACVQARLADVAPPPLPRKPSFGDFAAWEQNRPAPPSMVIEPAPPLFSDPLAEADHPLTGDTAVFHWDAALQRDLNQLARRRETGLYAVMAATLTAALHRWTGNEALVLGVPTAARLHPDTQTMVGAFVKTLPLRADCAPNTPFNNLLLQVRGDLLHLLAQQQSDPMTGTALQAALVLQNTTAHDTPDFFIPGLTLEPVDLFPRTNRLDLSFNLREHEQGLTLQVEYDTRRFVRADIELLTARWQTLAQAACGDPATPLDALPFHAPDEHTQAVLLDVDFDF